MRRGVWIVALDVVGGLPLLAGWTLTAESGGWYTARSGAGELHICDVSRLGDGRALCVLAGRPAVARTVAGSIPDRVRSLSALLGAPAAVWRRWPFWRVTGTGPADQFGGSTSLAGALVVLPVPVPAGAPPWTHGGYQISAAAPAFPRSIAGFRDDSDAEDGGAEE